MIIFGVDCIYRRIAISFQFIAAGLCLGAIPYLAPGIQGGDFPPGGFYLILLSLSLEPRVPISWNT